jgi:hypothetical protein
MKENTQLLVAVRHGAYGFDESSSLTQLGRVQMQKLEKVIRNTLLGMFRGYPRRICFSFSTWPRALESALELLEAGDDLVVTYLYLTNREEINDPQGILAKLTQVAAMPVYQAAAIIVVAHGDMPAVLAETARATVTGDGSQLPRPSNAAGYVVNLGNGEVVAITPDGLTQLDGTEVAETSMFAPDKDIPF